MRRNVLLIVELHLLPQTKRMTSDTPWYEDFFGESYLRIYAPFLPDEKNVQEVEHIINLLNLAPGSSILDLACGYGRHTIPLAQRGYAMTGLDLSEVLLTYAETEAARQQVQIRWEHGDMRNIPFKNEFDAVLNIFTSFGYFADEDDDLHVLTQVREALKPGGLFLLDTVYQVRLVRSFSPHGIIRYDDGLIVLEERRFDLRTSRNEVKITMLYPDGQRREHSHSMRIYTLTELTHLLSAAGLTVQAYYGGLDRSPLTMDSRMVILAQKASI